MTAHDLIDTHAWVACALRVEMGAAKPWAIPANSPAAAVVSVEVVWDAVEERQWLWLSLADGVRRVVLLEQKECQRWAYQAMLGPPYLCGLMCLVGKMMLCMPFFKKKVSQVSASDVETWSRTCFEIELDKRYMSHFSACVKTRAVSVHCVSVRVTCSISLWMDEFSSFCNRPDTGCS